MSDSRRARARAVELLEKCVELRSKVLGEAHLQTIETKFVLAGLYHTMGEHELANPLHAACLSGNCLLGLLLSVTLCTTSSSNSLPQITKSIIIVMILIISRFSVYLPVCLFVCLLGRRERLGDYHEVTLHTLFASAHALSNSARARDRALAIPLYEEYLLEAGNKLKAAPSVDHHYLHNNNDNSHIQPLLDPTDPRSLYFSLTPWSITDPTHALRMALDHCAEAVRTLKRTLAGE